MASERTFQQTLHATCSPQRIGDQIVNVNGHNLINEDSERASALLRSTGDSLTVVLARVAPETLTHRQSVR